VAKASLGLITETMQEHQNNTQKKDFKRRKGDRRRNAYERRSDNRTGSSQRLNVITWIRTLIKPRLGVDRRKGNDPRRASRLENIHTNSVLTEEELRHLLDD